MGKAKELAETQRRALAKLKKLPALDGFYLAGGSAVAYHLSHRRSNDLDLFSARRDADLERVADQLSGIRGTVVIAQTDAALKIRLGGASAFANPTSITSCDRSRISTMPNATRCHAA